MSSFTTLTQALEQHATDERSLTYIEGKETETTVSFKQLHRRALGMLHYFQQLGLKPGDQLIIFLRNNEKFLEAFWAALFGGIIPVPVAVGISEEHRSKLYKIYNKLESPFIFTDEDNLERLRKYAEENNRLDDFEQLKSTAVLADKTVDLRQPGNVHEAKPDDVCFIQFSSGSTSDPKGVVLTHQNLVTNVLAKAKGFAYTEDDIALSWMPLTHDLGLIGYHINMVTAYMQHYIMATDLFSRRPGLWLQKVSEKRATVICSPNFGYKHFLKAMADKEMPGMDLSSVRVILNAAEPISTHLCDEFLERMKPYGLKSSAMIPVYGLAEATLIVSIPPLGTDYRAVHVDRHKLKVGDKVTYQDEASADTVSFPIVGLHVADMSFQIGDQDGNAYEENTIGSIQIKGPTITQGYYHDEEATKAVMKNGWLDTGDLGFIINDELVITGRSKEIIFAHGQNYYPHDLESILIHSNNIELGKVAVFGIWDEQRQRDELLVFIIFRGDLKEFVQIVKDIARTISEQAGLEVDYVIPVNRIPKTTSGKFQRRILADAFENGEYNEVLNQLESLQAADTQQIDAEVSSTEEQLKKLCNSVLENTELSTEDNFFEIGISSLALAEMHQKIDEVYPGKTDVTDFFEYQTINELSSFIKDKTS